MKVVDSNGERAVQDDHVLTAEHTLILFGRGLHQNGQGAAATVEVYLDSLRLNQATFPLLDADRRSRLGIGAYQQLPDAAKALVSFNTLQRWLIDFCDSAWPIWSGQLRGVLLAGDPFGKPADFWLKPYFIKKGGSIIFGPPGRGKSYLMMVMGVSCDAYADLDQDHRFWECSEEPCAVEYVNLERSEQSMRVRLARVNEALGLDPYRALRFLTARGRSLTEIQDAIRIDMLEYGVNVVIIDSLSRAGMGDLNKNDTANSIVDMLNGLDVSWAAVGHAGRSTDEHLYGSVHFDAGADLMTRVLSRQQPGEDLMMKLSIEKANDIPHLKPQYFGMGFTDAGLSKFYEAGPVADLEEERDRSDIEVILEYLQDAKDLTATATEIATATGRKRPTLSKLLNALSRDGNSKIMRVGSRGKDVLYGLLLGNGTSPASPMDDNVTPFPGVTLPEQAVMDDFDDDPDPPGEGT